MARCKTKMWCDRHMSNPSNVMGMSMGENGGTGGNLETLNWGSVKTDPGLIRGGK